MNAKPIGPLAHGVLDYAFAGMHALAPSLFNLKGRARSVCYGFAATHAGLAAMTDYPAGVRRVVPYSTHGKLDLGYLPALLAVPAAAGALRQRNALRYFATMFAVGTATWLLTDFERDARHTRRSRALTYDAPESAEDVSETDAEAVFAS